MYLLSTLNAMLLQILQHTPPWVFALFVVLLIFGYLQSRPRNIGWARVAILPVALVGLALSGIWAAFGPAPLAFACWLAAIAVSVLANRFVRWPRQVRFSAQSRQFTVEGSWLPLAVMMVIFFTRYAVSVAMAMEPSLKATPPFVAGVSFAYGLMSGAFLARAVRILQSALKQARE